MKELLHAFDGKGFGCRIELTPKEQTRMKLVLASWGMTAEEYSEIHEGGLEELREGIQDDLNSSDLDLIKFAIQHHLEEVPAKGGLFCFGFSMTGDRGEEIRQLSSKKALLAKAKEIVGTYEPGEFFEIGALEEVRAAVLDAIRLALKLDFTGLHRFKERVGRIRIRATKEAGR